MVTTQQNSIPTARAGSSHRPGLTPPHELGSVHYHDQRVTEQTEDMHWAIDVLAPVSDSDVGQKYVATGILVVLANDGATDYIRKLSATALTNSARFVS